ncbi:splicing factor 3B subunit 1-like [Haliotis rubra]|uniref:splicing factor 3B subunit 1-like n=1 Tax=Haliotis rubra TaxID=36100 RepID=UPI001EE61A98|nr:splicing factor 3B subunit 1-like [Haliotis rubra]
MHTRQRSRSISCDRSPPRQISYSGSDMHARQRSRSISCDRSPPRQISYSGSDVHTRRRSRSISCDRSPPRQISYSGSGVHARRRSRSISCDRSPPRQRSHSGSRLHARRRSRSISCDRSAPRQRSHSGSRLHARRRSRSISCDRSAPRQRSHSGSRLHARRRSRSISCESLSRRRSYSGSSPYGRGRRRRSITGSISPRRRSYSGSSPYGRGRRRRSITGSISPRRRSYSGSSPYGRGRRRRSITGSISPRRRSFSGSNSLERRRRKRRRSISSCISPKRRRLYSGSKSHDSESTSGSVPSTNEKRRRISTSSSSSDSRLDTMTLDSVDPELFPFVQDDDMNYFGRVLRSVNLSDPGISQAEVEKRRLIGIVLKIKNGPPAVAQGATRDLQNVAKRGNCCKLFNLLLPMIFHKDYQTDEHQRKLIETLDALIYKAGRNARPVFDQILDNAQGGLYSTQQVKQVACRIISKLTKVFGSMKILSHLTPDVSSPTAVVSNANSYTVAVIAKTSGVESVLSYVKTLCDSGAPAVQEAGFATIQSIVYHTKKAAHPYIRPLMEHLQPGLKRKKFSVWRQWAEALAAIATMATKEDYPAFSAIWDHLLSKYRSNPQIVSEFEQSAALHIMFLKPGLTQEELDMICDLFAMSCTSPDDRISAQILCRLSPSSLVADDVFEEKFLRPFLQQSFLPGTSMTSHDQFSKICVRSARRLGVEKICTYIVDGPFKQDSFLAVTDALVAILKKHGLTQVTYHTERRIVLGLMCAGKVETFQNDDKIVSSMEKLLKLLRRRLCFHSEDIKQMLTSTTSSSSSPGSALNHLLVNLQGLCSQDQLTSDLILDGCVRK